MEISSKDFAALAKTMTLMTKTISNFDARIKDLEHNFDDMAETVTIELPKAIAEQVENAVVAANDAVEAGEADATAPAEGVEETVVETPEGAETVVETVTEGVCPECGKNPCECEGAPAEGQDFCGDGKQFSSFEEFAGKVTKTVEDMSGLISELSTKADKMFKKVISFSEGDDQVGDVTKDEADVAKVEEDLKESPKEFVGEEEPQIDSDNKGCGDKAAVVVETVTPVVPPVAETPKENFSARYKKVKNIFNM